MDWAEGRMPFEVQARFAQSTDGQRPVKDPPECNRGIGGKLRNKRSIFRLGSLRARCDSLKLG